MTCLRIELFPITHYLLFLYLVKLIFERAMIFAFFHNFCNTLKTHIQLKNHLPKNSCFMDLHPHENICFYFLKNINMIITLILIRLKSELLFMMMEVISSRTLSCEIALRLQVRSNYILPTFLSTNNIFTFSFLL